MKTFFVGANGKVARHFADYAKDHETIEEVAMIRDPKQASFFEERGIETVHLDLIKDSIEDLAEAMKGSDAVIFSAGAGGASDKQTLLIDLDGAVKAMTAAEKAGIKRFVMVSTFRTGREEMSKDNDLQVYTVAKNYADEWLKHRTNLDWTIVHPGILTDTEGTGKIRVGMGQAIADISRQDVAKVLVSVLENDQSIHKEFEILGGEIPIEEALKSI